VQTDHLSSDCRRKDSLERRSKSYRAYFLYTRSILSIYQGLLRCARFRVLSLPIESQELLTAGKFSRRAPSILFLLLLPILSAIHFLESFSSRCKCSFEKIRLLQVFELAGSGVEVQHFALLSLLGCEVALFLRSVLTPTAQGTFTICITHFLSVDISSRLAEKFRFLFVAPRSSNVTFFPLSLVTVSRLIYIRFCSSTSVEFKPSESGRQREFHSSFSLSSESILTFGFFSRRVRKKGSPTVSDSHFSAFRSGEFVSNRCVLPRAIVSIVSIAELRRTLN